MENRRQPHCTCPKGRGKALHKCRRSHYRETHIVPGIVLRFTHCCHKSSVFRAHAPSRPPAAESPLAEGPLAEGSTGHGEETRADVLEDVHRGCWPRDHSEKASPRGGRRIEEERRDFFSSLLFSFSSIARCRGGGNGSRRGPLTAASPRTRQTSLASPLLPSPLPGQPR